jgi:hypothetical protein
MKGESDGVRDAQVAAEAHDELETPVGRAGLFVVSVRKLVILNVLTFTLYSLYWFYKHWAELRTRYGVEGVPLLRAIFQIFFVHRLFKQIDVVTREEGFSPSWKPGEQATLFIVLLLGGCLLGNVGGIPGTLLDLGVSLASVVPLAEAQKCANLASGDPEGRRNARWSVGEILVAGLGALLTLEIVWTVLSGTLRGP